MSELDFACNEMAREYNDASSVRHRWGKITAVNTDKTVSLRLGGGDTVLTDVKVLSSYIPRVDDTVLCLSDGQDLIVMSSIGAKLVQAGKVTFPDTPSGDTSSAAVTFSSEFSATPIVNISARSISPAARAMSVAGESLTGFTAYFYNAGVSTATGVSASWSARLPTQ